MVTDLSGSAVLEHIFRLPDSMPSGFTVVQLKELVAVTCWYLWWIQRRHTHGEFVPPVYKCKLSILAIAANAAKVPKLPIGSGENRWSKPKPRVLKINVDASFHVEQHAGAIGAILRDYEGSFVAARCIPLPHVPSVAMLEALAMKLGLQLAMEIGCNRLIAESDSSETIEACTGKQEGGTNPRRFLLIVSI
jgi:hypothetical protein